MPVEDGPACRASRPIDQLSHGAERPNRSALRRGWNRDGGGWAREVPGGTGPPRANILQPLQRSQWTSLLKSGRTASSSMRKSRKASLAAARSSASSLTTSPGSFYRWRRGECRL